MTRLRLVNLGHRGTDEDREYNEAKTHFSKLVDYVVRGNEIIIAKGCILLFNKWDLVKGFRMEHCLQGVEEEVPFLLYCPKLFISALTGRNVDKIFPLAQEVAEASKLRIKTGQLNKFIGRAMQRVHPPMIKGKRLRIYYLAQVSIEPPTFVLFVNYPHLMLDSYQKYLINQFREIFPFSGVPLIFRLKQRTRETEPDEEE